MVEQSKKQQTIIFRHTLVAHMKQNVGHIINMKKKEDTLENMEQLYMTLALCFFFLHLYANVLTADQ